MAPKSYSACVAVALSLTAISSPVANAATILNTVDIGNYTSTGNHNPSDTRYTVGQFLGQESRNFITLDASGISDAVSAKIRIYLLQDSYVSTDLTETLSFFEVTTPSADVRAGGSGLIAIFNDLGSGTDFGSLTVSEADERTFLEITLTSAAISALNASTGEITIGGALTTINPSSSKELLFVTGPSGHGATVEVVVETVPEPSSSALLGLGSLGLLLRRKRS